MGYPCWRYHKNFPARLIHNPGQEVALGAGWVDNPAKVDDGDAAPVATEPPPTPQPPPPAEIPLLNAEHLDALLAGNVATVSARMADISEVDHLAQLSAREDTHKGRKGVLKAITARLDALEG